MIIFFLTGRIKIAEFLLKNGANVDIVDSSGQTPLQRAVGHGIFFVKYLDWSIRECIQFKQKKTSSLCYTEEAEMVELLIKHGANVNMEHDNGRSPLHLASRNGKIIYNFIYYIQ